MDTPYSADRSLYGKLRRRLAKMIAPRPAKLDNRRPMLTISFDDAPDSAAHIGAAILRKHGICGTYFISAGLMGRESHLGRYADEADIRRLSAEGHEIACHTFSHLDCGKASGHDIASSLEQNQQAIQAMGIAPSQTFAYPYGDVSPQAKHILNERYLASRALHHGLILSGTDLNQAPAVGIEGPYGESNAYEWMQRAVCQPQSWLVLYTHDVRDHPSAWGCKPEALDRLMYQAVKMGFNIVTFEHGARCAQGLDQAVRAA